MYLLPEFTIITWEMVYIKIWIFSSLLFVYILKILKPFFLNLKGPIIGLEFNGQNSNFICQNLIKKLNIEPGIYILCFYLNKKKIEWIIFTK